jgi:hypothetical protein
MRAKLRKLGDTFKRPELEDAGALIDDHAHGPEDALLPDGVVFPLRCC